MTNILTDDLLKAADMRSGILKTYRFDRDAANGVCLCERLAAANTNDPQVVDEYQRLVRVDAEKLNRARWGVMSSIGYGFTPESPDEVLRAIIEKVRAA